MLIIEAASAKIAHPVTLQKKPCMVFKFDTGHQIKVWSDVRFYLNRAGRALNPKTGSNVCSEMDALVNTYLRPK